MLRAFLYNVFALRVLPSPSGEGSKLDCAASWPSAKHRVEGQAAKVVVLNQRSPYMFTRASALVCVRAIVAKAGCTFQLLRAGFGSPSLFNFTQ